DPQRCGPSQRSVRRHRVSTLGPDRFASHRDGLHAGGQPSGEPADHDRDDQRLPDPIPYERRWNLSMANPFLKHTFPKRHGHRGMSPRSRMRGISLIEVMVSVLVLGVGLLGIAAMQSVALRGGQSSLESTQAVMQTTAIIEAMRANWRSASDYNTG